MIIANRATVTAYEGVALLLTVARTFKIRRETDRLGLVTRLSTLLLRDGEFPTALMPIPLLNISRS